MHNGHRARLKKRFLKYGPDSLEDHEILELLLFYGIPQKDTNELAHRLINTFGSLPKVFDTTIKQLMNVNGIGESTAILIKLFSKLFRTYQENMERSNKEVKTFLGRDQIGKIILNKFVGRSEEHFVLTLLDTRRNLLFCDVISKGTNSSTEIYLKSIIELSLKYNAVSAIIAHNHPSGIALPSKEDLQTTKNLALALKLIHVKLIDHLIVADNDYTSFADTETLRDILNS